MLTGTIIATIITSVITFVLFFVGKFTAFKKEDDVTVISPYMLYLVLTIPLYVLSLIIASVLLLLHGWYLYAVLFAALASTPYVIGSLATYQKLNRFVNLQIIVLMINLLLGVYILHATSGAACC